MKDKVIAKHTTHTQTSRDRIATWWQQVCRRRQATATWALSAAMFASFDSGRRLQLKKADKGRWFSSLFAGC